MVFGELLGGLAMRGGQRMHEDLLHQRKVEDWQREQDLNNLSNFIAKNWDNLDADQQGATANRLAQITGKKPQDMNYMITAAKAIHGMIPQIQATQESLGPNTPPSSVAVTPSREAPVTVGQGQYAGQQIQAPAAIEFGQVPSPASVLSPSIMAPTTGGEAYAPSQTPLQVRRQRAQGDIRGSGMGPREQKVANQALFGVPPSYETGMEGIEQRQMAADQRYTLAVQKMNAIYNAKPTVIKRGDVEMLIWGSGPGAKVLGPDGVPVPYQPDPADKVVGGAGNPPLGSDFRQYIQRKEDEIGRKLTADEVQAERNAFPDSPVQIKTVENGQDVIKVIPRSQLVKRKGAGTAAKSAKGGAAAVPAGPTLTPIPNAPGATPPLSPVPNAPAKTPTISPIPNTPKVGGGGLTFPSQQTASEKKLGDEYEQSYRKVMDVEQLSNPEFMGAWRGSDIDYGLRSKFPEIAKWMGRPDITPEESVFRATVESMTNSIMHLLSGAAVTPSEKARIMGELPDASNPGSFEGKMLTTKRNAAFLLNRIRERKGQAGTQVPSLPGAGPTVIDSTKGVETPEARKARLFQKYGTR